jgi:hypothetical protein
MNVVAKFLENKNDDDGDFERVGTGIAPRFSSTS